MGCGMWNVGCEMYDLEFGIWFLEFGPWNLELGIWDLVIPFHSKTKKELLREELLFQNLVKLFCKTDSPGFADNSYFYLTRIGHFFLYFARKIESYLVRFLIGNLIGSNYYA